MHLSQSYRTAEVEALKMDIRFVALNPKFFSSSLMEIMALDSAELQNGGRRKFLYPIWHKS